MKLVDQVYNLFNFSSFGSLANFFNCSILPILFKVRANS